jgi:hypothetical protein
MDDVHVQRIRAAARTSKALPLKLRKYMEG